MKKLLLSLMTIAMVTMLSPAVKAQQPCSANFQYVIGSTSPSGTTVSLFDSSFAVGTITNWSWTFNNGTVSTQQNPVVTMQPGYNVVCLTIVAVYINQTCTNTYCDTIFIPGTPPTCNANFTYVVGSMGVNFSGATGSNVSWTWSFGDGTSGTGSNPYHTYTSPGTYTVCLTVLEASGVTCNSCQSVVVPSPAGCQAYFTSSQIGGTTIWDFTNMSQGNATYFWWSFGDGSSSTLENPSHTYNSTGPWLVCLTITDSVAGCSDTFCDSIGSGGGALCDPSFTLTNSPAGVTVFVANAQSNVNWSWDFGDGTVATGGPTVTHVYTLPGTYTACLIVTTANGNTCTSCQNITISNGTSCSSNFAIYPDSLLPHTYYAYNLATGAAPLTYVWSWGDGTSSTGAYPSHTYASGGLYTICLTITDATGCSSNTCYQWQLLRLSGISAPVTINVIPGTTGVQEHSSLQAVSVYPNPANDYMYAAVSLIESTDITVNVMNIAGQQVYSLPSMNYGQGTHEIKLDIADLSKGMYLVEIQTNGAKIHKKVIVE